MKRKIPSTMATQHPDHANIPYWHEEAFINVTNEGKETYLAFSDLGIEEYNWDWEGKLVDEAVMERFFSEYYKYFKDNQIGKDKFLTFRLPNPKAETDFRLARAFLNILTASALAKKINFHSPPLFEVIIPMTESAEEMIAICEAFQEISELKHVLYNFGEVNIKHLEIIPLFEQVQTIIRSNEILEEYIKTHKEKFGFTPSYLRPYVARSDPALNSGIVPTVLAIKIAFSRYKKLSKKLNIPFFPIIGCAALPFRGGLAPDTVEKFIDEYNGVKTVTIQSAFRYDYDKDLVKKAINILNTKLPKSEIRAIPTKDEKILLELIPYFEQKYKITVEIIAPIINKVASYLPKRRERVQHIGLFGYSRGMGKVSLPRAIGFTAALYSIGIPPELLGTGSGIQKAIELKQIKTLKTHYKYLKKDIIFAGRYLNKENLDKLIKKFPAIKPFKKKIKIMEEYFGEKFAPKTFEEKEHQILTGKIWEELEKSLPATPSQELGLHGGRGNDLTDLILRAAKLRRSLG